MKGVLTNQLFWVIILTGFLSACSNTKYLKEAIEKTTNLKVSILDGSRKNYGNNPALLVVGTKPF